MGRRLKISVCFRGLKNYQHQFNSKTLSCLCNKIYPAMHNDFYKFKGIYLSKALTCMNTFLYKQELLFCQGDGYFWPHCGMNNLYISHRSLYAQTYSFWAIGCMLISPFRVTSWFDTVNNAVTHWMNFRENHLHEHDLQLFDYNL